MLRATLHFTWRSLSRLTRITLAVTTLLVFAIAGILLGLRYWILPDIERYHSTITASITQAIGQPVSIGKIEADWRGLHPHLQLSDVRVLDKEEHTALMLQQVDGVLSWKTLLTGQVRLSSLELNQPDLLVKRDAQGKLYIAGMPLSDQSSDNDLANLLLHQARVVVRDARITWMDEQRATPLLVFNKVNLLLENGWNRHRFSVSALPPAELSTQLDVRGDFYGASFDNLKKWQGQLYTRLDYADVAAWNAWLPQLALLKRGKGALRGWLDIANGTITQATADLALSGVEARLAGDLPPLDLRTLHGRLTWQETAQGFEIATQNFSLQMSDGLALQPTDFYLRLADVQDRKFASGEARANTLDLAALASLPDFLPLGDNLKRQLAEYAPRGQVSGLQLKWQSNADKLVSYEVKTHFHQLSMKRTDNLPGFSGLSGELDGSDNNGTLLVNTHRLTVDAPQILTEPLQFDTFTAQSSWQKNKRGLEVKLNNITVSNADIAGNAYGSFQTLAGSPGQIDLTVHLTRAAVRSTDRYIPLFALDQEAHEWVRDSLLDGQSDDFRLRLHGDLKDFPFPDDKKGIFQIQARAKGVVVEYVKGWPRVTGNTAELSIHGNRLEVTAPAGMTAGASLKKVSVAMPDMASPDLVLQIRGEAQSETARGLDFIQKSPVRGYIDGFTDGMTARGNGNLFLQVDVPLRGNKPVKVAGSYRFADNEINLGKGIPLLSHTNGVLLFTESSMHTQNASAQILGGPATIALQSGESGAVHASANGHADFDTLNKIAPHPLYSYLRGGSDWQAEITTTQKQKQQTNIVISSNLFGVTSSLPAPFSKSAQEIIPLHFEKKSTGTQQEVLSLQYGKLLGARFLRIEEKGDWSIKRGTVNFGNAGKWMHKDGVWITGTVPQLSLEGWGTLFSDKNSSQTNGASLPGIDGIDELLIHKLSGYGQSVNDLRINARNSNGVFTAQLAAKEVNGEASWHAQGGGKLVAHLKNLSLYDEKGGKKNKEESAHKPASTSNARTDFPTIDLTADELTFMGKQLGRLELLAQQHERDWLLDKMHITNPDGVLTADGKWDMSSAAPQTQINLKLEISNAGKILARSGYPNSVKDGEGKLEGMFSWPGGPDDFSYAMLDGNLKLDTGKGQFLKIEPGIGKLLSILSLQALPRRITLDFTDVFSEGFKFDSITGTSQVKHGVLSTNDFKIEGSAAKVTMKGQIDLDRETQDLRVRVLPTLGNSVSLLGAFAAGPVVGAGVFLANKLLREPLDQLVSFEYNITGTWADPNVVKLGEIKPAK